MFNTTQRDLQTKLNMHSSYLSFNMYASKFLDYSPIAFEERVTFFFYLNAPGHCLVHVCLLHYMCVRLHNAYT